MRLLVARLHDVYVTEVEWELELHGFIESFEFTCAWAGDSFHIYVSSKLKQVSSFKKGYTMTNLVLVGSNKRIIYGAIEAT